MKSVKRFERSNGLDTALYKNYLFLVQVRRLVRVARLDSAWAGVSYAGMDQVLHDINNVTDSGCHCVSADQSSRVVGSVASSSKLLLT